MEIAIVLFLICFMASTLGAIAGFGGGVIIKPVVDMLGILPVETISFLSGCTVLSMSVMSLIKSRRNGTRLDLRTSTPLALGSVVGGLCGKWVFEMVKRVFKDNNRLGAIQSACLLVILIFVFLYICRKDRLRSYHVTGILWSVLIGLILGLASSFLGIGGGPYNVAVLFLFYSMDSKTAAKNSIYIIMFSQLSSLLLSIATHTVPVFSPLTLVLMAVGGVCGALLGAVFSKQLDADKLDVLLKVLVLMIIVIVCYNFSQFAFGV